MDLRYEIEQLLELSAKGEKHWEWEGTYEAAASSFLRDHGPALVEALVDAERYWWLRDNDDPSGEAPYVTRQVCNSWGNWVDDVELTGAAIDTAIDIARTKASAGEAE